MKNLIILLVGLFSFSTFAQSNYDRDADISALLEKSKASNYMIVGARKLKVISICTGDALVDLDKVVTAATLESFPLTGYAVTIRDRLVEALFDDNSRKEQLKIVDIVPKL